LGDRSIVVFDVETNGLHRRSSVLSFSALKLRLDTDRRKFHRVDEMERFYHCREPENPKAIAVNGLHRRVIDIKRDGAVYPLHFDQDREIPDFFHDAGLAAAHNVDFDRAFLGVFPELRNLPYFCTMKSQGRFVKLHQAARMQGIPVDSSRLHGSTYDTHLAAELLKKLILKIST